MPREFRPACEPADAGTRLDVFLARKLPEFSREHLKLLIAQGHCSVNGHASKPSHKLRATDRLMLTVPDPVRLEMAPEAIALDICYEDETLLVVNKPRGMLTHPASSRRLTGSLVNALLAHCTDLGGIHGELRPGIVHRLDRETSGLMVVAKSDAAQRGLSAQFKARTVSKFYFALARGCVRPLQGVFDWPIGRHPVTRNRMRVDERRGRSARTEFRVLKHYAAASLILVRLHTGRTHQIRVHLAHAGHPLLGDVVYGSRREATAFKGVALHSARLAFDHPATGRRIVCSRPVPPDFQALIRLAAAGDPLTG